MGKMTQQQKYAVFQCTDTLGFWRWGRDRFGVWVPIELQVRTGKGGQRTVHEVSPLPGYAFVPEYNWRACFANADPKYRLWPLHMCEEHEEPVTVELRELTVMQQALNDLHRAATAPAEASRPKWSPRVGERVVFGVPPFEGQVATVRLIRRESIRVLIGTKYITTSVAFLRRA